MRDFNNRRGIIKIYSREQYMFSESFPFPCPLLAVSVGIVGSKGSHRIGDSAFSQRGEHSTFPIFHETRGTCMTRRGTTRLARRRGTSGGKSKDTPTRKNGWYTGDTMSVPCCTPENVPKFFFFSRKTRKTA